MNSNATRNITAFGWRSLAVYCRHRQRASSNLSTIKRYYSATQQFNVDGQPLFTHNPKEGYIRHSPIEPVAVPNSTLDEYIWQNLSKWPNHDAVVGLIKYLTFIFMLLVAFLFINSGLKPYMINFLTKSLKR